MEQDVLIREVLEGRLFIFEPEPYYGGSTLWLAHQTDFWYLMERHEDLPWVIRYPREEVTFERVRRGWPALCTPLEGADPRLTRAHRAVVASSRLKEQLQSEGGVIELQAGTHFVMYSPVGGFFQLIAADPPNLSLLFAPLPMLIRRLWHQPNAAVSAVPEQFAGYVTDVLVRLEQHMSAIDSGQVGFGPAGGESIAFLFKVDGRYLDVLMNEDGSISEQTLHNPYARVVPRRTVIARVLDELQSPRPRRCLQAMPSSIVKKREPLRQALARTQSELLEECVSRMKQGEWISLGSAGGDGVSLSLQGGRYIRRGGLGVMEGGHQDSAQQLTEDEARQLLDTWLRLGLHPDVR